MQGTVIQVQALGLNVHRTAGGVDGAVGYDAALGIDHLQLARLHLLWLQGGGSVSHRQLALGAQDTACVVERFGGL